MINDNRVFEWVVRRDFIEFGVIGEGAQDRGWRDCFDFGFLDPLRDFHLRSAFMVRFRWER